MKVNENERFVNIQVLPIYIIHIGLHNINISIRIDSEYTYIVMIYIVKI